MTQSHEASQKKETEIFRPFFEVFKNIFVAPIFLPPLSQIDSLDSFSPFNYSIIHASVCTENNQLRVHIE